MTDKQIIIDEIDVSGCEKQGETIAGITCGNGERIRLANEIVTKHKLCKDNPNCVYKQLKHKEQECEELKKNVEHWKMEHKEAKAKGEWTYDLVKKRLGQQIDQLKAENEELKKQVCGLRPELKSMIDKTCSKYNIEAKYYHEKIVEIINNLDKYKQTLTEIKEIAETISLPMGTGKSSNRVILAKQILQKISEAENE